MDKEKWDKCVEFYGHECPGLAIGFKVCEAAIESGSGAKIKLMI